MEIYHTRVRGERVTVALYSLREYEADGGEYDDSPNGGESFSPEERGQFLAAMTLDETVPGLLPEDVGAKDTWYDSVTGYYLLRDWPTSAPLAARCGTG